MCFKFQYGAASTTFDKPGTHVTSNNSPCPSPRLTDKSDDHFGVHNKSQIDSHLFGEHSLQSFC